MGVRWPRLDKWRRTPLLDISKASKSTKSTKSPSQTSLAEKFHPLVKTNLLLLQFRIFGSRLIDLRPPGYATTVCFEELRAFMNVIPVELPAARVALGGETFELLNTSFWIVASQVSASTPKQAD